jgi:hypothetical protein
LIASSPATAWYVYGVVRAGASVPELAEGVCLVGDGSLAAVAGEVPLAEFGEDALVERLNDRIWLEEKARAHEEVLRAFLGRTPVVPLRFGAIYRDVVDVRRLLEERRGVFEAALGRLSGHVELGVKAWLDRDRFERALAGVAATPADSGRAYLERRRGELAAAREASARAAEIARVAHERLLAAAVDGVANRPQPPELTGRPDAMLLNGAYLVRDDEEAFVDEVAHLADELAASGVTFELTGPWPPYNFVGEAGGS